MAHVLSDEGRTVFEVVNFVFISSILGMFGIACNIVNVIIFYKQGFKHSVNVGFLGLAISDIICLLTLQWSSILLNPLLASSGFPWYPMEVMYLTGAWPHTCFSRITSFITVFITAERYFSIAFPLKVKHIITAKTAALLVCLIFLVNVATLVPEYATSYLDWRFVPSKNKTLIGILFTSSRTSVEGVVYVLHSVFGMTSFAGVILFTVLLVTKLKQSSQWRASVVSSHIRGETVSNRDKKTVKMVALIASILIACYTPGAVIALTTFIVGPEFNIRGEYINICHAMWSIACACQCINSTVNIFIYYSMSSKYRQTFAEIICRRKIIE